MNVKEWFKQRPYWLKGGIISLLIVCILYWIPYIIGKLIVEPTMSHTVTEILIIPFLLISLPLFVILSFLGFFIDSIFNTGAGYMSLQTLPGGQLLNLIITIIYYFLIGAIVGIIIPKIKSK